jgi:predicted amidohydrolase
MKICAAQTIPVAGEIEINIGKHKKLIDLAVLQRADVIIFPELSLTGYEPRLARQLATTTNDERLNDLQLISDVRHITIGVGMPIRSSSGILISMIFFRPNKTREIYSKQYLHKDEYPYFINGEEQALLTEGKNKIAPAICYELSVPAHAREAFRMGAEIYIASVAKSAEGVQKAIKTLSGTARKYSMTVLMSNCAGLCDGVQCAGQTSIWDKGGLLAGQLNHTDEGILIIDTATQQIIEKTI